jgi:flagellar biogenesis protein FliO
MAGPLANWLKKMYSGVLGRMHMSRGHKRLELVETLNLGGKRQLMLIRCDGESYLIGAGGEGVHSIQALQKTNATIATDDGVHSDCEDVATSENARRLH